MLGVGLKLLTMSKSLVILNIKSSFFNFQFLFSKRLGNFVTTFRVILEKPHEFLSDHQRRKGGTKGRRNGGIEVEREDLCTYKSVDQF